MKEAREYGNNRYIRYSSKGLPVRKWFSLRWLAMATVLSVGFGSATAADVNLNNGWEAFPTPESRAAAIKLGKALFWDEQLGSGNGGQYACASCHYQAGADSNPLRIQAGRLDNGIFGSLGVTAANFQAITCVDDPNAPGGLCAEPLDTFETVGALHITGRNAPTSVDSNSIHNFWDGRANYVFNGIDITGEVRPGLFTPSGMKSVMILESSQASQAVGPPNSDVEMAAAGRTFNDLAFKMCHVIPLATQSGDIVNQLDAEGLRVPGGYITMIQAAFGDGPLAEFLSDEIAPGAFARVSRTPGLVEICECTITEANFALFFGLAIQAYEQTLSSQPAEQPTRAMVRAFEDMRCDKCHYADGRSHAVTGDVGNRPFAVTGVAPLAVDPGVTEAALNLLSPFPNDEAEPGVGSFKSNHMFNLPLTAPYFHDGSAADLQAMLDFYVRGGNHDLPEKSSHVRPLDATPAQQQLVIEMMELLTDPRIAEGSGPYAHPSLKLPLADGSHVLMRASDDPAAQQDAMPGLSYVHVTLDGQLIGVPAVDNGAGVAPAVVGGDAPAVPPAAPADDAPAPADHAGAETAGDAGAGEATPSVRGNRQSTERRGASSRGSRTRSRSRGR